MSDATDRAERVPARRQGRIVIRETEDGIGVYNPARREPLAIGFLSFWLIGWAVGEVFVVTQVLGGGPQALDIFVLLWLAVWTAAGFLIGGVVLWQLVGVEKLFLVGAGAIVVERGFRPFGRRQVYPVEKVSSVGLMPDKPPEVSSIFAPRRIGFVVDGTTRSFGIGLDEAEAAAVLSELRQFVDRFAPPEPERTERPKTDERENPARP
ncbi:MULTISPECIES: hypothetical protein [Nitratireductor]|uniref:hypothetical protein n=1 Tax=Nitratireductor TaxID=245876 RepID=UPI000D0CEAB2|nr:MULTISPECIES: hypothetical protein [Nitratireductor]PSM19810.1 hypothetical protein C7T96_01680 [Nitratireductor sp. StC3]